MVHLLPNRKFTSCHLHKALAEPTLLRIPFFPVPSTPPLSQTGKLDKDHDGECCTKTAPTGTRSSRMKARDPVARPVPGFSPADALRKRVDLLRSRARRRVPASRTPNTRSVRRRGGQDGLWWRKIEGMTLDVDVFCAG